jgi:ubiquinone/menaquinone biosynthesis C-methylase UbiE
MIVLVTDDPVHGEWQLACEPFFGDPNNLSVFEIAEFNGYLYAGTANVNEGFQLWKTDAEGEPPYRWKKVITCGAYRGKLNEAAITFRQFGNYLYLGSGVQDGGWDFKNNVGPVAVELIRVSPDDSWDIVVGSPRFTPDGFKVPLSGLGPGFGNPCAGYLWSLCEHEGWLYAGTFDWFIGTEYSKRNRWPEHLRSILTGKRIEQLKNLYGGFDLWRSRDGSHWVPVTRNGFGNYYNYGVRTMVSTPHGLFLGATNPFGPEVAVKRIAGWNYEYNQKGGLEVWLGSHYQGPAGVSESQGKLPNVSAKGASGVVISEENSQAPADEKIISQFYGGSGFRHFGYWWADIHDAKTACENLMDELLAFIPDKKGTILDIDCGQGATSRYLLKHFPPGAVTGIITDRKNQEVCRKSAPRVKFLYRKLPKLELPADSFDFIMWVSGLKQLPGRPKLLQECFRILKPGGRLVCFDVVNAVKNTKSLWNYLLPADDTVKTLEEYRNLLINTGFLDVRLADVTGECLDGFRKHVADYFELQKLCGEIEESSLQATETYLLMHETKTLIRQCLLISGCKSTG